MCFSDSESVSEVIGSLNPEYLSMSQKGITTDTLQNSQDTTATVESGYQAYAPITLSGKKYVFNKQVSKYVVMPFFSNNTSILSFVLTDYGFMLPCVQFMHLALLDHSVPDYARRGQSIAWC